MRVLTKLTASWGCYTDPAYPPNRQTIYLEVAQPRALVILALAGALLPSVRAYVEEKLSIRVEIPALQILASGHLLGSTSIESSDDVLASSQSLATQPLNIPLGPDSIATLSFTSGSTGIPKGVRGRHFSLTHFFPWMAKTFGLNEDSKFTMLSGIAHDPIQRDSESSCCGLDWRAMLTKEWMTSLHATLPGCPVAHSHCRGHWDTRSIGRMDGR